MPLRVLICDDEPLAVDRLDDLLSRCSDVELVGTALNGADLLEKLDTARPDVLLLDVEMPRMDGFDVVEALSRRTWLAPRSPPLVVFVTAHPELAAQAFDTGALDFISKPVRLGRLERALARAQTAAEQMEARRRLAELSAQLEELKRFRAGAEAEQHLWVRKGTESLRIAVTTIDWVGAEGEYVRFHSGNDSYLERGTLSHVAARLEPFGFVRIHRSFIVNAREVASIDKGSWSRMLLRLRSGTQLPIGKKYRNAARSLRAHDVRGEEAG
jgi:DNA-binding LytR/AlgR family response regulator